MDKGKILYADDEEGMRELVSDFLTADGFSVITACDGRAARDIFLSEGDFSLVILDVMMPGMDGYETLKLIKKEKNVPVILLTAKTGEYDELRGFSIGADEYIKKPFRPKILVARVNAVLSRKGVGKEEILSGGGIEISTEHHSVSVNGEALELTGKEFELLSYFLRNKNMALSRDQILNGVWEMDFYGDERTVDTHVKKLRSKLGAAGEHIKTVWAFGYKFED